MSRIIYLPLPNAPKPLQADTLVMSNGLFALGRLAQSAVGLKNLVMPTLRLNAACFFKPTIEIIENQQAGKMRGVETVVQCMALHHYDNIMASNGNHV
jgi:hypothetical protein